jgi:predicted acylesterase/phospholipase RssA
MSRCYLLSIDSGGIRGIIPAVALVKLENTTGKLTREIFTFVAGTSTGAIIAAAIAAGIPATRILDLYINRTREIFTHYPWNIIKRILFGSMYSIEKLHDLIAEEIGPAHAWKLNDSPIDLLITAKRISDGMLWYFVRDNPNNSGCTGRLGSGLYHHLSGRADILSTLDNCRDLTAASLRTCGNPGRWWRGSDR